MNISDKIFIKFRPGKYDFKLYKGFFMEKIARICQIWMIPPRAVEVCMPKFYPPNTGNYKVAFFHQIKAIKGRGSAAGKKHGVEIQGVDELILMGFVFLVEAQQQTQPDKPLAPPSQAHWQRSNRSFNCKPLGLKPKTFCDPRGLRRGLYSLRATLDQGPRS
jgi:hypothetical protein